MAASRVGNILVCVALIAALAEVWVSTQSIQNQSSSGFRCFLMIGVWWHLWCHFFLQPEHSTMSFSFLTLPDRHNLHLQQLVSAALSSALLIDFAGFICVGVFGLIAVAPDFLAVSRGVLLPSFDIVISGLSLGTRSVRWSDSSSLVGRTAYHGVCFNHYRNRAGPRMIAEASVASTSPVPSISVIEFL